MLLECLLDGMASEDITKDPLTEIFATSISVSALVRKMTVSLPGPRFSGKTCRMHSVGVPTLTEGSVLLLFRIVGNLVIIAFKYPTESTLPFCLHLGQNTPVALSLVFH